MKTWKVFGLGGLFRVTAETETEAVREAHKMGLVALSWVAEEEP